MKKSAIITPILILVGMAAAYGLSGCNNTAEIQTASEYTIDPSDMVEVHSLILGSTGTITEAEKAGLIKMREEEKLARDVYMMLGQRRANQTFKNIAASEQTHTNAIKTLLTLYGIEDPVKDDRMGAFTDKNMEFLYINLLAQGNLSITDALIVGATVEDLDIKDLNDLTKDTTNSNILAVYNNLNRGSRNHLRAYVRNIERNGGSYTGQYISSSELEAILNSAQESGRSRNRGNK